MERRSKIKWFTGGVIVTLLALALLYFLCMHLPIGGTASKPGTFQTARKEREIADVISRFYLGESDAQKLTDMIFAGEVAGLGDPYSCYYTKEQYKALTEQREGEYVGIGITFIQRAEDGVMVVEEILPGSPAEVAGLMPGDLIRMINGHATKEFTTSEFRDLIQKESGQEVELDVLRGEEAIRVTIVPGEMEVETAVGEMLEDQVGLIRITKFVRNTPEQYRNAYETLKAGGMRALILDLRGNGGGLVESACEIAEQILPEGVIVYEEDKYGERNYHQGRGAEDFNCPLVVLVDERTASAAEILTGAIQDYEIGTIVGMKTYGKGIVQNYYRLSDGSVLQLTTTHYYTPDGNDIHLKGISPDVTVEAASDGAKEDPQLERALALLK